jgi:hypothetical protein
MGLEAKCLPQGRPSPSRRIDEREHTAGFAPVGGMLNIPQGQQGASNRHDQERGAQQAGIHINVATSSNGWLLLSHGEEFCVPGF